MAVSERAHLVAEAARLAQRLAEVTAALAAMDGSGDFGNAAEFPKPAEFAESADFSEIGKLAESAKVEPEPPVFSGSPPEPVKEPEPPVEFVPLPIASRKLGVAPDTIRRAARDGRLGKSYKISERKWMIEMGAPTLAWVATLPAW